MSNRALHHDFVQQELAQHEVVPETVLRDLAKDDPLRAVGEISVEHQVILATYLPEICGELIALRSLQNHLVAA